MCFDETDISWIEVGKLRPGGSTVDLEPRPPMPRPKPKPRNKLTGEEYAALYQSLLRRGFMNWSGTRAMMVDGDSLIYGRSINDYSREALLSVINGDFTSCESEFHAMSAPSPQLEREIGGTWGQLADAIDKDKKQSKHARIDARKAWMNRGLLARLFGGKEPGSTGPK